MENAARVGLPIPEKLKSVLLNLKEDKEGQHAADK